MMYMSDSSNNDLSGNKIKNGEQESSSGSESESETSSPEQVNYDTSNGFTQSIYNSNGKSNFVLGDLINGASGSRDPSDPNGWFKQTEFVIFSNELKSVKRNNNLVLKECKENKRLLDLKYNDLNDTVNNIQTSVIFFSTISGFLQATRIQFSIPDTINSIISITISTYISLLLSISKYYKLDELKEKIQNLREKYSLLHNKLDHRMDVLGPWSNKKLWEYQDPKKKLQEWNKVKVELETDYQEIIETKQGLVTEFEIIMDTKSRNKYHIINRQLNYSNREQIHQWDVREAELEEKISSSNNSNLQRRPSITLQHEELDNWDDDGSDFV